jgi:hypothetical protein
LQFGISPNGRDSACLAKVLTNRGASGIVPRIVIAATPFFAVDQVKHILRAIPSGLGVALQRSRWRHPHGSPAWRSPATCWRMRAANYSWGSGARADHRWLDRRLLLEGARLVLGRWCFAAETDELAEIEDKIKQTKVSKEAREKAQDELKNLHSISAISGAERPSSTIYFDCLPSIAWNKKTKAKKNLTLAQRSWHRFRYQAIVAPEHLSAGECWAAWWH